MAKKYLDNNGLLYLWGKIKATFVADLGYDSSTHQITKTKNGSISNIVSVPYKTSDLTNDSGFVTSSDIPDGATASTTTPKMDGTASVGSETAFARGDHRHPSDTTKVDKVTGKGLSTNDYTDDEKSKLAGIAAGAEVNVQSDWNQTTTTADDYIKNKPTIPSAGTGSSYPVMDGTRALGSQTGYARVDHVHPSDTSRVPTTRKVNGKALSSDITLDASDVSAIPTSEKGAASGVCPLDANSKVDASYLPSYVDDVIEAYARSGQTALSQNWLATGSASGTAITPEAGKIYVLMADSGDYSANSQFRWSGTTYVKMADGGVSSITNAEIDTIVAA